MNREIKFRVWASAWKPPRMITLHDLATFGNGTVGGALDNVLNSPNFIVEQFTGLKDKNGKEIYEGDICKAYKPNSYLDGNYLVAWHNEKGRWYYKNQPDYKDLYQVGSAGNLKCEVIGNIHENKDLIK